MVLIVESDFAYAEKLRWALQRLSIPVHTVTDGLEALRWLRASAPQVILAEQSASWVDAFHLCRLTKFHKRYAHMRFMILALEPDEEHRRLADAVNADAYLGKTGEIDAVIQTVKKLLAASSAASTQA